MSYGWITNGISRGHLRHLALILGLSLVLGGVQARPALEVTSREKTHEKAIPAAEFARLITDYSEEGGYFRSDNFVSNETSYLHIIDRLKELGASGGAYIGVGPEQNFTYIAKIRPRIAFIVDIRRQAIIQHLMFKAIFHHAGTRARFLFFQGGDGQRRDCQESFPDRQHNRTRLPFPVGSQGPDHVGLCLCRLS
jgi:hypothetical protein